MPYNRNLYSSSESAIDAGMVYDQTEEKLQSEINAEVSSDITELDDSLATFVRPNLLDNWYFAGGGSQLGDGVFPINQSGQTSYSGSVASIDRWRAGTASTSITLFAAYVRFTASAQGANFFQEIKEYKQLAGKVITLSAMVGDHVIGRTVEMPTTLPALTDQTDTLGTTLPITNYEGLQLNGYSLYMCHVANVGIVFYITAGSTYTGSLDMKGAKLEIGTTQTLAHQENGVWVLNEIPNWREEYMKVTALNKTGDTMTGTLLISNSDPLVGLKNTSMDVTSASYSAVAFSRGLVLYDKNTQPVAMYTDRYETDGSTGVILGGNKRINNENKWNYLRLLVKPDGTKQVLVTDASAWRKGLSLAYAKDDTMSITSSYVALHGLIGNTAATTAYFEVVTEKSMENISTVTVTTMSGYIAGPTGAINSTTGATNYTAYPYTILCTKQGNNHVRITVTKSSAFTNVVAYASVTYFGHLALKFT